MADFSFETNLRQFELELDAEFNQFYQEAIFFSKEIAQQLLRDILAGNPYWSGRSKASWVVSLNGPIAYIADDIPKRPGAIAAEEADARALATLSALDSFRVGDTIHVTQGNKYIALIEDGVRGSNAGFIAQAVARYSGLGNFTIQY